MAHKDPLGRFWAKVQKGDTCWNWSAATFKKRGGARYGAFVYQGRCVQAHRWIYQQLVGPIPDGKYVCHSCDNPLCVRLDHLFVATPKENSEDMVQKHRQSSGEARWNARMTPEKVRALRERYAAGETQVQLAEGFGIDQTTVCQIIKGKTWKNAGGPVWSESVLTRSSTGHWARRLTPDGHPTRHC